MALNSLNALSYTLKKNRDLSLKIIVTHLLTAQITLPFNFIENKLETMCLTKD